MRQVTGILIGAGLRGGHVYAQYALEHPDEFRVIAVAEPEDILGALKRVLMADAYSTVTIRW